jgi:hypothetical protein
MKLRETSVDALNDVDLVCCSLVAPLFMSFTFCLSVGSNLGSRHILCHITHTIPWCLPWCCWFISVNCNMSDSYVEGLAQVLICITTV